MSQHLPCASLEEHRLQDRDSTSELDKMLKQLAKEEASFPENITSLKIRNDLDEIMQKTLAHLAGKYRLFQDGKLYQAGSMSDGTKIGSPDEFDYNIELPTLYKQLVTLNDEKPYFAESFDWRTQATKKPLKFKDESFAFDIFFPEWVDEEKNAVQRSQQLMFKDGKSPFRDTLSCMVSMAICRSLTEVLEEYPSWRYVAKLNAPAGKSYVQLFKYKYNGVQTFVSVDICLAIKLPYESTNSEDDCLQLLFDFWSVNTVILSRRSEVHWEQGIIRSLPVNAVEKQCYRVLKYLTKTFLTSSFSTGTLEYKPDLDTYTLKTMFLKVITESNNNPWLSNELGEKVLIILRHIYNDLTLVVEEGEEKPTLLLKLSCHPISGEPALFQTSKAVRTLQARYKTSAVFHRPGAIAEEILILINLLLMVQDTEDGRRHFIAILEAMKRQEALLKNATYQEIIMDTFITRNNVAGFYNTRLLNWYVIHGEELKGFLRDSKYGIIVQPLNKKDDCVVTPKEFSPLKWLQCDTIKIEKDGTTDLLELDVLEEKRVVCWNVSESIELYHITRGGKCSFCNSER